LAGCARRDGHRGARGGAFSPRGLRKIPAPSHAARRIAARGARAGFRRPARPATRTRLIHPSRNTRRHRGTRDPMPPLAPRRFHEFLRATVEPSAARGHNGPMHDGDIDRIAVWLVERGLAGTSEADLLHGFCARCWEAGLHLSRAVAFIDTLHPVYEGRAFRWRNDGVAEDTVVEYGSTDEGEAAASWQRSPLY